MKKIILNVINAVSVIIIVLAVAVLLTVVMTKSGEAPKFMGFSVFRIMTGSMEPTIPTDSLVLVKETDPWDLREGDVISFYSLDPELNGMINTHRVVAREITSEEGLVFTTKGDANMLEDDYPVLSDNIVGKVVWSSPFMGGLVRLTANPLVFLPFIIVPLLALLLGNLIKTVRLAKQMAREEEEKAVEEMKDALALKKKNEEAASGTTADCDKKE